MTNGFYRAFEDKHRGSRQSIKERQRAYLPFIEPLASIYSGVPSIDLGCGRGEWLELLAEAGFEARGVDLDDGMLAECRALGLNVETQDALTALKRLPDASQAIVSGFQFAEHIPFEVLQLIVQEALRVLKPAGLLILETPNPENIVVGSTNFYLDPSHQRPLPPLLMEFLPEYYGFPRVKVVRLQEPINLADTRRLTVHDVLASVSPDYAIVAQKMAEPALLQEVGQAFDLPYGVTLGMVTSRYEDQGDVRLTDVNTSLRASIQVLTQHVLTLENQQRIFEAKVEGRRARSRLKRVVRKAARIVDSRAQRFVDKHPVLHRRLIKILKVIGVYKVLNRLLRQVASISNNPRPSTLAEAEALRCKEVLAQQPAVVLETFQELEGVLKKAEKQ